MIRTTPPAPYQSHIARRHEDVGDELPARRDDGDPIAGLDEAAARDGGEFLDGSGDRGSDGVKRVLLRDLLPRG